MRYLVTGLTVALLVAGLWRLDSPANAHTSCATLGAVSPDNTALVSDCETLLNIRNILAGTASLNWAADTPIKSWDGISVGGTPLRVTDISLAERGLTGTIPSELGDLSSLEWLSLLGNQLSGYIPPELGDLSYLTGLHLSGNQLSGAIPAELGSLSNLGELYLSGNQLSGCIPEGLRYVEETDLDKLSIPHCDLLLSRLTVAPGSLNPAFDPYWTYYIAAVGSASHFTVNPVNDYNATIHLLDENYVEVADGNDTLAGHQVNLGDGTATVNIRVISLDESVTHTYTIQASRKSMTLNACATGGAVSDPAGEPGLVSDCVALLSARDTLAGGATLNWSEGTLIQDWDGVTVGGTPRRVTEIRLFLKQLSGTIPAELGSLSNLMGLDLGSNQLSGTIPAELGSLSNLEWLFLDGNRLSGTIPAELGGLSNLAVLYLSGNELSGTIPVELGSLSNLTWLVLDGNQLSGTIPAELGSLSNLTVLELSGNQLSGTIPTELGGLSNLELLYLWANQLSGTIPAELGGLSSLELLFLSGNQLSGCIPEGLRDVPRNDLDQLGLPFCGPTTVTVSITATSTLVRIDSPIPVTAVFSEPVSGFTIEDISVVNGSAGSLVGSNGDSVYTFDVTPNAIVDVTVYIAAAVAEDGDGNANTAAVQLSLGIPYDDDHNGAISRQEVITAIGDYLFSGVLTRDQVTALISLYFFG